MSITLELPPPINEELTQESRREGISETEHAALLVCLASAFKHDEPSTPFQNAIRDFLAHHSLDAERVFSAFEELVKACLPGNSTAKSEPAIEKTEAPLSPVLLRHWRNAIVHQQVDSSYDLMLSDVSPLDSLVQAAGRISRDTILDNQAADPTHDVFRLLRQWQAEDNTPLRSPAPTYANETPTQALFRNMPVKMQDTQYLFLPYPTMKP